MPWNLYRLLCHAFDPLFVVQYVYTCIQSAFNAMYPNTFDTSHINEIKDNIE